MKHYDITKIKNDPPKDLPRSDNPWMAYFAIERDKEIAENGKLRLEIIRLNKVIDKLIK